MESTESKNEASAEPRVPFWERRKRFAARLREKFALQKWDVTIALTVVALIASWVMVRGNLASAGPRLSRPLRVGIVAWPGYAGGLVANNGLRASKDSYFWDERGLLVKFLLFTDDEKLRRDSIRGGDDGGVDIMWSTVDSLAQQLPGYEKEGVHPRAFMQVDWSRGGDAIVASSRIKRIEDLRGKKIAVSNPASLYLLEDSLERSSLTDDEKSKIRLARHRTSGSQEARDLFVQQRVDAAVLWEPYVEEAIKKRDGAHILVHTKTVNNLIADVMVAKKEFILENPDVIRAFIEGWLIDGTPKAIDDPMLAVKALQSEREFARLTKEKTHELLTKTALAKLDDNVEMFGLTGGEVFFDRLFNQASRIWVKGGYITTPANAEKAREIEILQEVYSANRETSPGVCGQEIGTPPPVAVVFPSNSADLLEEAREILAGEEISLLLHTRSGAGFCVEVGTHAGDDPQRSSEISRDREKAVIEYLVARYGLRRNQFVPANGGTDNPAGGGTQQYIRLKINSIPINKEEDGARSVPSAGQSTVGEGV